MPRVCVVTPTWQRHDLLFTRCLPSVVAQTYQDWEHVVVSDGPDPGLREKVELLNRKSDVIYWPQGRLLELPEHAGGLGAAARNYGIDHSDSELLAFLDDDNAYRPHHLELLIECLDAQPGVDFAYGRLYYPESGTSIGMYPPEVGQIDSSSFVCRRKLFDLARWPVTTTYALDWELVGAWLAAGAKAAFVPEITLDYWWARR